MLNFFFLKPFWTLAIEKSGARTTTIAGQIFIHRQAAQGIIYRLIYIDSQTETAAFARLSSHSQWCWWECMLPVSIAGSSHQQRRASRSSTGKRRGKSPGGTRLLC